MGKLDRIRMRRVFSPLLLATLLSASLAIPTLAASGRHVAGPMLGYVEHREALVWIETRGAEQVTIEYWRAEQPESPQRIVQPAAEPHPAGGSINKFILRLLDPGQEYHYRLEIDGAAIDSAVPLRFRTRELWEWRRGPPDFSFLVGSCAFFNEAPFDRPGAPYGRSPDIFLPMANSGADFMVWLGDNTYLREVDWSSESGIWHRYMHDRATPALQPLLAAMPHYATWDDHDYGPNNSNSSYELKEVALAAFTGYWGNQTAGQPGNPGVYHKFTYGDAQFIVMDNRYHRDDSRMSQAYRPGKTQYGATQLEWLKQSLLQAQEYRHIAVKFIVTGGQFLEFSSDSIESESHNFYREERDEILRFIDENQISGVVFLTGDVHYTSLVKYEREGRSPLFELTSSPLTSGASARAAESRAGDPMLDPGTVVVDQNYCRVWLRGPRADRELVFASFDRTGKQLWERVVKVEEIAPNRR
jgi:alkaline phosphatase D